MACCYCGSNMHDTEHCRWNGTGKRVALVLMLTLAVGCAPQKQQAEVRLLNDQQAQYVRQLMQGCGKIVADAADRARADGVEVTGSAMDRAYQECLIQSGATI